MNLYPKKEFVAGLITIHAFVQKLQKYDKPQASNTSQQAELALLPLQIQSGGIDLSISAFCHKVKLQQLDHRLFFLLVGAP